MWLGHESVETTQIYLETTLAMKEQALAKTTPPTGQPGRYQSNGRLLGFLSTLQACRDYVGQAGQAVSYRPAITAQIALDPSCPT